MARGEINPINMRIPLTEIDMRIRGLKKSERVMKRLYFVKFRYYGK